MSEGLVIIMQITEKCNLKCSYCYLYKKKRIDMPLKVAYRTVDFANELLKHKYCRSITLCFHGGEPTITFDLIKKIVKRAQKTGINKFIIGTNAICIDEEKIEFMVVNNFSPTISLDGISKAQNLNRPFTDGSDSWDKVDRSLDLFGQHIKFWFHKYIPDPLRIRISLTPETLPFLSESVRYLVNKRIGQSAAITIMPAMSLSFRDQWRDCFTKGILVSELYKQMQNIADFYIERLICNKPFTFCINECLTPSWSSLINPIGLKHVPFCGAGGSRILGVSLQGGIYPCYLHAANPEEHKAFCMGDVFSGITRPEAAEYFCGNKKNEKFSCLFWNRFENNNPNKPALIYSLLYQTWQDAVLYIRGSIYKNLYRYAKVR